MGDGVGVQVTRTAKDVNEYVLCRDLMPVLADGLEIPRPVVDDRAYMGDYSCANNQAGQGESV